MRQASRGMRARCSGAGSGWPRSPASTSFSGRRTSSWRELSSGIERRAFRRRCLSLAGLEARVLLVDDVRPPLPPDDAAVFVALLERAQRIADLHDTPS